MCTDTVREWRSRFAASRLAGLKDAPRSGRPPVFTAADRAEVVALARALPAESGVPLSKRSGPDLAREVAVRCGITVSASTIRRRLARDALRPWQHRSWISVRDPQFAARAAPVLDLYAGIWDGRPLGPDDYVICADEKTSIQARCLAERAADPPARARLLAGPGGNLLSVVQRKVLTPNDFTGLDQIRDRLAAFETRYNAIARPFTWKFTSADLDDLLRRIDAHDESQPHALAA